MKCDSRKSVIIEYEYRMLEDNGEDDAKNIIKDGTHFGASLSCTNIVKREYWMAAKVCLTFILIFGNNYIQIIHLALIYHIIIITWEIKWNKLKIKKSSRAICAKSRRIWNLVKWINKKEAKIRDAW